MKKKTALTLVELMITVSILTTGIVLILRSFLTSAAVLESMDNRIKAMQLLSLKMSKFEQEIIESGKFTQETRETLKLGIRDAEETIEISPLEIKDVSDVNIDQVSIALFWQEAGKSQDMALSTYLPGKK